MSNYTTTPTIGAIGLVRIRGEVGAGIRAGQWLCGDGYLDYEHAVICTATDGAEGQWVAHCMQAEPGGASLGTYQPSDKVLWWDPAVEWPDVNRAAVADTAVRYLGTPYSFLDYAAIAAHRLHTPIAPFLREYIADDRHMICSQLVDQVYADCGLHLFQDGRWPGYVTPGDLYQRLHGHRKQDA